MYRFNLQVLLDYRKRIEEGLQIECSHIQQELETERQALLSCQQEKVRYEEELAEKESREVNLQESVLYRDYLRGMRKKIEELKNRVATKKIELDNKQEELLVATKNRKVLEKVKEKHAKEFMHELEKKERTFIDEVGIRRYQRSL
ncbi:MAG: flagellar export protein FliJ [Thermodesulfobacteriota bacterium]|nr:flagellar export protein FliJ [Thermodesulfobacteriota bacterium]